MLLMSSLDVTLVFNVTLPNAGHWTLDNHFSLGCFDDIYNKYIFVTDILHQCGQENKQYKSPSEFRRNTVRIMVAGTQCVSNGKIGSVWEIRCVF